MSILVDSEATVSLITEDLVVSLSSPLKQDYFDRHRVNGQILNTLAWTFLPKKMHSWGAYVYLWSVEGGCNVSLADVTSVKSGVTVA